MDENFIGIYPNVLSQEECEYLIDSIEEASRRPNLSFLHGKPAEAADLLNRHDYSFYVNNANTVDEQNREAHLIVDAALIKAAQQYAETYFPVTCVHASSHWVKLQKTPKKGGFHQWHCENSSLQYCDRALAWTIYLNDVPEGEGQTEFLWQGVKVQPKAGTCAIWPAFFTHVHRGNPVYSCEKYIATGWYTYDERSKTNS